MVTRAFDPHGLLSVGEVALRSGVPVSTLHFYERQGFRPLDEERIALLLD